MNIPQRPVLVPGNNPQICPAPTQPLTVPQVRQGDCCAPGAIAYKAFTSAEAARVVEEANKPNAFLGLIGDDPNATTAAGATLTCTAKLTHKLWVQRAVHEPTDGVHWIVTSLKYGDEEMLKGGKPAPLAVFSAALPSKDAHIAYWNLAAAQGDVTITMIVRNISTDPQKFRGVALLIGNPLCSPEAQTKLEQRTGGLGLTWFGELWTQVRALFGFTS